MSEGSGAQGRAFAADGRKSERSAVHISAELLIPSGGRFKVAVHDLSATGFRIQTANPIPLDRLFYLKIPGLQSLQAKIAWNDREYFGCQFVQPLHPSICTHLANRFPSVFS